MKWMGLVLLIDVGCSIVELMLPLLAVLIEEEEGVVVVVGAVWWLPPLPEGRGVEEEDDGITFLPTTPEIRVEELVCVAGEAKSATPLPL